MFTVYKKEKTETKTRYEVECPKCGRMLATENPEEFRWSGSWDVVTDCPCGEHFATPIIKVKRVKPVSRYVQEDPGKI